MALQQASGEWTPFDRAHIDAAVAAIDPATFEPVIRRAADDLYERVLDATQDYLRDNMEGNLKSHLAMVEGENARMRLELFEADRIIGGNYMTGETRIAALRENDAKLVNRVMFAGAAARLLAVFDQQRMTVAERIVTGASDAELKAEGNAAIEDLREALRQAQGDTQ